MDTAVLELLVDCLKDQGPDERLIFNCMKALEYSLNYDLFADQSQYSFEIKKYLQQLGCQEQVEKYFAHKVNQVSELAVQIIQDYFQEDSPEDELANRIEQSRTLDGHLYDDTKFNI